MDEIEQRKDLSLIFDLCVDRVLQIDERPVHPCEGLDIENRQRRQILLNRRDNGFLHLSSRRRRHPIQLGKRLINHLGYAAALLDAERSTAAAAPATTATSSRDSRRFRLRLGRRLKVGAVEVPFYEERLEEIRLKEVGH